MAEIGEIIDSRWKIVEKFKPSGQAHTYKVKDLDNPNDTKKYVLKLLKKINDKALARFEREIKASFSLNHENIVCAKSQKYENNSEPYLVTELCTGGDINEEKIKKLSLVGYDLVDYSLDTVKMFHTDALAAGYKV